MFCIHVLKGSCCLLSFSVVFCFLAQIKVMTVIDKIQMDVCITFPM